MQQSTVPHALRVRNDSGTISSGCTLTVKQAVASCKLVGGCACAHVSAPPDLSTTGVTCNSRPAGRPDFESCDPVQAIQCTRRYDYMSLKVGWPATRVPHMIAQPARALPTSAALSLRSWPITAVLHPSPTGILCVLPAALLLLSCILLRRGLQQPVRVPGSKRNPACGPHITIPCADHTG